MKTIYRYLFLAIMLIGGHAFTFETYANNDYVCSYHASSCGNIVWEQGWRFDGTKHGIGTKTHIVRIGNTRVGCPSTSSSYGSEAYRDNGGFMFGDVAYSTSSCELVMHDNVAPSASAHLTPQVVVTGYTGTIPCTWTGCTPTACNMSNGPANSNYCTPQTNTTGYNVTPQCSDNESGCKPVPADFVVNAGFSQSFTVYDRANNSASCTVSGNGAVTNCSGSVLMENTVIPPNLAVCSNAYGGGCVPDSVMPNAEISYSPSVCTNQNVTVTNTCISDLWDGGWPGSGCRPSPENKWVVVATSNQAWTLGVSDVAGNITDLLWSVDWIDKAAPIDLEFRADNQKASLHNIFVIKARDDLAGAWCANPNLGFRIDITGAASKTITGVTPRDGSFTTWELGLTGAGDYSLVVTVTDQAGNTATTSKNLTIFPAEPDASNSSVELVWYLMGSTYTLGSTRDIAYANNSDTYVYKLKLKDVFGNAVKDKRILNVPNQEWGARTIKTDMTNPLLPTGSDALIESWSGSDITNINGRVFFNVKSLAPGEFSERFKVSVHKWGDDYVDTADTLDIFINQNPQLNSFRKTFVWSLSVTTSPYSLSIWTTLTTKLSVTQKSSLSSYAVDQFKNQMRLSDNTNHEFQNLADAISLSNNPTIDFRINAATNAWVNIVPRIFVESNPIISYNLSWQAVRYRLSATDSAIDDTDISLGWTQMNSLKVSGNLQWQGKYTLVGQNTNFSDISKSDTRAVIRKNAYLLIKWRTSSETVIGGVKYHEGDYTLSWDPNYETLIVKNGNLKITGNFNTSGKKFGIIVLRDDSTKSNLGNIYLQPGVRYVWWAIYADGGIVSTGFKPGEDTVWVYRDSAIRTDTLSNQLVIKGSLFTRNTIGWAIKGSTGKYILPGGSTTNDFDLAMMYDLNYLRRNNGGYNVSGANGTKDYNGGNTNNVVIIFDANLQKNPPKGFAN